MRCGGHSNIQGLTDCRPPVGPRSPGYLTLPKDDETTFEEYMADAAVTSPLRPGPDELLAELSEVHRQLPEGDLRRRGPTPTNDWAYDWLPKLRQ